MYCQNCGKEILDNAIVCIHCGVLVSKQPHLATTSSSDGELGCLMDSLCFVVPIIGLIVYITWLPSMPKKAKSAGLSSWNGLVFITIIIMYLLGCFNKYSTLEKIIGILVLVGVNTYLYWRIFPEKFHNGK